MKRFAIRAGLGLLGLIVLVMLYAATRPSSFRVDRAITISAEPSKIMPLLTDLHRFADWSPWQHLDPQMSTTYSGSPYGPGAIYEWSGNKDVGSGRMQILDVVDPTLVRTRITFIEPFASENIAEYRLTPKGAATEVVWSMSGPMPYVSKLMSVFVSMDSMIGGDFERGLGNLKQVAER